MPSFLRKKVTTVVKDFRAYKKCFSDVTGHLLVPLCFCMLYLVWLQLVQLFVCRCVEAQQWSR